MTSQFRWATVTAVGPVRITLDGDTSALPITPDSLIDPRLLAISDRVRCEMTERRIVIHGRSGGAAFSSISRVINGAFRQNQRGYASGATIPIGAYSFDRWKASGRTNLAFNPAAIASTTGWARESDGAATTQLTALTIPGLAGVTTAARATMTAAVDGIWFEGEHVSPFSAVTAFAPVTMSMWIRSSVAKSFTLTAYFYNAGGTALTPIVVSTTAVAANTWTRISGTTIVPAGGIRGGMYATSTTAFSAGATVDGTAALIETHTQLLPYFDGSMGDCSFAGTANASTSYNVPNAAPTLTFTADPHGQAVTLSTGGRVSQIIERANLPAGAHTFAHDGTATMRAYNNSTAPGSRPAFAASPISVTLDGTDDVVLEFTATSSPKTIQNVRHAAGAYEFGYSLPSLFDEIAACARYYVRHATTAYSNLAGGLGYQISTTVGEIWISLPTLRAAPIVLANNLVWSDVVNFEATISGCSLYNFTAGGGAAVRFTFASNGASLRPGTVYQSSTGTSGYLEIDAELR